jgi:uncharacterized hydrophobic protein (TIGR00271 family)
MEDESSRAVIIEAVRRNSALDLPHTLMNVLAASIASYGLLADSTAVVIGAMIVAMLLNPILGVSMGLAESDHRMIHKAGISLIGGLAAVFIAAFIIGLVHQEVPITNQITARTAPSFFDLVIALAGGAAGAYATVSLDLSVAFVGVAVATALVPPLSACAILLARGDMKMAEGALLLTFTNIVGIQFSSSVVFWLMGFRTITRIRKSLPSFLVRNAPSLVLVLVLAVVFLMNFKSLFSWQLFEARTRGILKKDLVAIPGSYLADVRFDKRDADLVIVRAVVRSPRPPSQTQVAEWEASLPLSPSRQRIELRIRYVNVAVIGATGVLFEDDNDSGKIRND